MSIILIFAAPVVLGVILGKNTLPFLLAVLSAELQVVVYFCWMFTLLLLIYMAYTSNKEGDMRYLWDLRSQARAHKEGISWERVSSYNAYHHQSLWYTVLVYSMLAGYVLKA